jgi:hypothetical protein
MLKHNLRDFGQQADHYLSSTSVIQKPAAPVAGERDKLGMQLVVVDASLGHGSHCCIAPADVQSSCCDASRCPSTPGTHYSFPKAITLPSVVAMKRRPSATAIESNTASGGGVA